MTNSNSTTDKALTLDYFSAHSDASILDLAAWLRAKYGDRFATFDEYAKIVRDSNHGRELVWAWTTHEFEPEVKGFLAGWGSRDNSRTKDMLAGLMMDAETDEQWEERQATIAAREPLLTHEVDLVDSGVTDADSKRAYASGYVAGQQDVDGGPVPSGPRSPGEERRLLAAQRRVRRAK